MQTRWAGHAALLRMKKNVYKVLDKKSEVRIQLGRLCCWKDNIKFNLKKAM
jgi:hypothetical protein